MPPYSASRPGFRDSRSSWPQSPRKSRGIKKKFSQIEASEGKKVTSVSKWALKIASADSADMDQTAANQNRLVLAISQWWTQKESPTSGIFPYSRCGPILTRIGAYENWNVKLFCVGSTFFVGLVSVFLFSVRKQKTEIKFQIGPKKYHQHKKERKKTSGVTLGTPYFERPDPE